jgi:putative sigma-54 modulation protein
MSFRATFSVVTFVLDDILFVLTFWAWRTKQAPEEGDMTVQVRFRNIHNSPVVLEHAVRRAHQHLSRFGAQVSEVVIRMTDLNGPRGGCDQRCQLTAHGPRLGTVSVSETREDAFVSLDLALERLARTVGRTLERTRETNAPL